MPSTLTTSLSLATLTLLTACGTSIPPSASPATTRNVTGNWQIQSTPASLTAIPTAGLLLLGDLISTGSAVTGTFRLANLATPNACGTPLQQIVSVSGTADAAGNLSLTSVPFSGSTLAIQLLVPTVLTTFGSGTIAVTGGNCTFASSSAIGAQTANVTGTYTGPVTAISTLTAPAVSSGNVALTLTQSSTPGTDGQFAVSATLTFTGGTCTNSAALTGTVSGGQITLVAPSTGLFTLPPARINAFASPAATSLSTASLLLSPDPCNPANLSAQYQGTLIRQ